MKLRRLDSGWASRSRWAPSPGVIEQIGIVILEGYMRCFLLRSALATIALTMATVVHAQTATQDINITATVTKACTINNTTTGVAGSATIPVSVAGAVDTTQITPTAFANVACNAPSTLLLTSMSGAVKNATSPASGFTNIIDYSADATWNGVTATLDTATAPAATTSESGTGVAVTAHSGDLTVTITPQSTSLPLITGSYSDTLRVTLTPQ